MDPFEFKLHVLPDTEIKVRYANNKIEIKPVYRAVIIEILGREGTFVVIGEEEGSQPLIGQVVLEVLDLIVDPRTRRLIPNPMSLENPNDRYFHNIMKFIKYHLYSLNVIYSVYI